MAGNKPLTWCGNVPTRCNLCGTPIRPDMSFTDGRLAKSGAWMILCTGCHARHGVGLGVGNGQRYGYDANKTDPAVSPV